MSYRYWDNTTSTTNDSTTNGYHSGSSWPTSNLWFAYRRTILVTEPKHWADEDGLALVRLVNKETRTGWIVRLRIKGSVLITDPNIETRTMAEFVPLLKSYAFGSDLAKIDMFFEDHPCKPPSE